MKTYAALDSQGRARRVLKYRDALDPLPRHVLPLVYPPIEVNRVENHVEQMPLKDWDVSDEQVTVRYHITPRKLTELRADLMSGIVAVSKSVMARGVEVELTDDRSLTVSATPEVRTELDEASRDAEKGAEDWTRRWRGASGEWVTVNAEEIELIRRAVVGHARHCDSVREDFEAKAHGAGTAQALTAIRAELKEWHQSVVEGAD